jgi:hypothetical protein
MIKIPLIDLHDDLLFLTQCENLPKKTLIPSYNSHKTQCICSTYKSHEVVEDLAPLGPTGDFSFQLG